MMESQSIAINLITPNHTSDLMNISQLSLSSGYELNHLQECLDHVIHSRRFHVSNDVIVEELICHFEISRKTAQKIILCTS
jgi:hypothetical protein